MNFPEAFKIGSRYRLEKLHEFEIDEDIPPFNALVMWEPPMKGMTYTIGVDPSWGVGEDRAAIHVMRNGNLKMKDAQVAEFCSEDLNVHDLVPICYMLGNLYKNEVEDMEALMSVECNISDDIVHQLRNNYNYKNLFVWKVYDNINNQWTNKLGWWTNMRTRPKIIIKGVQYIKKGWWDIRSPWTLNEFSTIEKNEDRNKVAAAAGHHDDLAFASLIALWSGHDMEFSEMGEIEEVAKRRDRASTARVEAYNHEMKPIGERKDFINQAFSYEDMMNYEFPGRD